MKTIIDRLGVCAAVALLLLLLMWDAAVLNWKHWRNPDAPVWLED